MLFRSGQDITLHNGFGKEHLALPALDVHLFGDADAAVEELLAALGTVPPMPMPAAKPIPPEPGEHLNLRHVAQALAAATGEQPVTFATLGRGWPIDIWPHRHPLDYLGKDGGGGLGSGPGLTLGAALALRDSGRLTVGMLGDGDTLMGINALWSAAHSNIPVLVIVANNRSYYNDELHQEGVALKRGRDPANRWIGQSIDRPAPDIARLAEGQGWMGIGPVTKVAELGDVMKRAIECVRAGKPCLVDVHIDARHGRNLRESMQVRGTESL